MKIHFMGGADTVTGSQHIIECNGSRVLRDCGLYQGRRKLAREINRTLPFRPQDISAMLLSHAHIDHCGNIPSLVRAGYDGPIYATEATVELCEIMLQDSAYIQEQDAAYLNQKSNRKGFPPVEPIYTVEDAQRAQKLFKTIHYRKPFEPAPGISATAIDAGHILGSSLTVYDVSENGRSTRVGFAVDLGRKDLPIIRDPVLMKDIDILVIESTYGNRFHENARDAEQQLCSIVNETLQQQGKVLIPSFALERAQELLYHLSSLISSGRVPQVTVYVDSPMATEVTKVFRENHQYMDEEYKELHKEIGSILAAPWIKFTPSVEASKAVTASKKPCIVIAASGMCEHGRILHHLKHGIEDPNNTVVIVGYQAAHTLGRRLVEKQEEVRIFGDTFERKADVTVLNAFSAHADRRDLIDYVKATQPKKTFLVHGEDDQREAFRDGLKEAGIEQVFLPARGNVVEV